MTLRFTISTLKERRKGQMENKGYKGKISNSGTQVVKAPNQKTEKGKSVIKTGNDLRK